MRRDEALRRNVGELDDVVVDVVEEAQPRALSTAAGQQPGSSCFQDSRYGVRTLSQRHCRPLDALKPGHLGRLPQLAFSQSEVP